MALVTGGGRGIGRAVAGRLAAADFEVVIVGRQREALDETVAEVGSGCVAISADLATTAGVRQVVEHMKANHRRLDILVNNAGMATFVSIEDFPSEAVDAHLGLNIGAALKLTGALIGLLSVPTTSHVINISSEQALSPAPQRAVYGATKAAVNYLTRALAAELAGVGIRVNALLPGAVDTDMLRAVVKDATVVTPLGPVLGPDVIAEWVMNLVRSQHVTGALITVDGGTSLRS